VDLFPRNAPLPWLKPGVFVGALVPLVVMLWKGRTGRLGADAIAVALNQLGYTALIFLTASLLCTPLKIATGWTWGIRMRRMLGLFAFFYVCLHFTTYAVLDQGLSLGAIGSDIVKRKFILVGFTALLLLIPLAITSTDKMVRRLGFPKWKMLHRFAYVAGILGGIHFLWRVKKDLREPLIFLSILALAFALRVFDAYRKRRPRPVPAPS